MHKNLFGRRYNYLPTKNVLNFDRVYLDNIISFILTMKGRIRTLFLLQETNPINKNFALKISCALNTN